MQINVIRRKNAINLIHNICVFIILVEIAGSNLFIDNSLFFLLFHLSHFNVIHFEMWFYTFCTLIKIDDLQ